MAYERSAPTAGEIALVSALTALAVASRAVFYLIPQFKPIAVSYTHLVKLVLRI